MADDLPSFPLVLLEADYPEMVGKAGLFDFLMPVGSTGIIFIAALPGILRVNAPEFSDFAKLYAYRRAASTLMQMGLVNGDTLTFLRTAVPRTQQEQADKFNVPLATYQAWESGAVEVPRNNWGCLAAEIGVLDGRPLALDWALCPPNFRPRRIRVFPQIPGQSTGSADPGSGGPGGGGIAGCPPPPSVC